MSYPISTQFKPDTWQRWIIERDARADAAIGIATLDGVEAVHETLTNKDRPGSLAILRGVFYAPDGPPHTVLYDDVSITILP